MAIVSMIDLRHSRPQQLAAARVTQFVLDDEPARLRFLIKTDDPNRSCEVILGTEEVGQLRKLLAWGAGAEARKPEWLTVEQVIQRRLPGSWA